MKVGGSRVWGGEVFSGKREKKKKKLILNVCTYLQPCIHFSTHSYHPLRPLMQTTPLGAQSAVFRQIQMSLDAVCQTYASATSPPPLPLPSERSKSPLMLPGILLVPGEGDDTRPPREHPDWRNRAPVDRPAGSHCWEGNSRCSVEKPCLKLPARREGDPEWFECQEPNLVSH